MDDELTAVQAVEPGMRPAKEDWAGAALYSQCAKQVWAAKKRAFPRGSVRRNQTQSLGEFESPFGTIRLSVTKEGDIETDVERCIYKGRLFADDHSVVGEVQFSTYRAVRGRNPLDEARIFDGLNALCDDETDVLNLAYALERSYEEECDVGFVEAFNTYGLMVAELLHIAPEKRGGSAWKILYFSTMFAPFAHQNRLFMDFAFEAYPLTQSKYPEANPESDEVRARNLRTFYRVHLDAYPVAVDGAVTDYMWAEVPDAIIESWAELKAKG